MRKGFITFGIIMFLIYCWASVVYQNQVDVPDYRLVEVDLLGGKSRTDWDADPQNQFRRLMELEGEHYQLPVNAPGGIPPDRALTADDFARFIASAPPGQPVAMELRDASAFYDFLARNYHLRDSIEDPGNPDGAPLYVSGHFLDKAMLDDLNRRNYRIITVTGHGSPVSFLPGTAIMIAIIFLTLVAALKPVLWGPFMVMLEKRRRELDIGAEAERQNQLETALFEEERRRRNADLLLEMHTLRLRNESDITRRVGEIVKSAREEEKQVKLAGLGGIARSAETARMELDAEIPDLAEAIANLLTPGRAGPRWDLMQKKVE